MDIYFLRGVVGDFLEVTLEQRGNICGGKGQECPVPILL